MRGKIGWGRRLTLGLLVVAALAGATVSAPAQAAAPEPDFVLVPRFYPRSPVLPPPYPPDLLGPCGLAIGDTGNFYVSNYYNHTVDVFSSATLFIALAEKVDPLDGPCGLAVNESGWLYVNNYHRNVERFVPSSHPTAKTTTFASAGVIDSSHPTGVALDPATENVYVNARTHIGAYTPTGTPLMNGPDPLRIGEGSLLDGYGLAISAYPPTAGRIYVPDHGDDTVKVYDPLIDKDDPVATIAGPPGGFGSLRDSAVAVDRVSGEVYVADTLTHPQYTERPRAVIYVFSPTGVYLGRLKYGIVDGSPPGLAVDNTIRPTQGRVYVTSGNTEVGAVYAYPKNSATSEAAQGTFLLALRADGSGEGRIAGASPDSDCGASCEAEVPAAAQLTLTATPDPGSAFTGWSGTGCSGVGDCTVQMDQAQTVRAEFTALPGPPPPSQHNPAASVAKRSQPASASAIAQKGNLRVAVSGKLAPKRLPRKGTAPVSVSVGGKISTTDKSLPPQLDTIRIELNRNGRLDATGLSSCIYDRIQPGSSSRALSACRSSLVGEGSFTANITLAGQEPYPTKGKLLVFHSVENGKPVLYGHIYSPKPFATSFVIVFTIQRLGKGTYGTALNAPLPPAMDAWGRLTSLQMTLSRRYAHKGERRSFISAGCPAPKGFPGAVFPLARTEFSFAGGKKLSSVLSSECKARG